MIATTKPYKNLPGDWRRRYGTKTDAHLWTEGYDYSQPACRRRIFLYQTAEVASGRPCTDCLVAAVRAP